MTTVTHIITRNHLPDALNTAIGAVLHRLMIACGEDLARTTTKARRNQRASAHAACCHQWNCLRRAITIGMQPVAAGYAAVQLGLVPDDWELPETFPGSARA